MVTWHALCLLLLTSRVAAAPCPYNASADLDSLLSQIHQLRSETEQQETGAVQDVHYARCDPFYDGDIFLDGMEPWTEQGGEPDRMTPSVQLWPGGVVYYIASVNDMNVLRGLNISIADVESRTASAAGPCVQFVPWSPGVSEDFLFITDTLTDCCFSSIGRRGGNQTLNIGMTGNNVGNIKHLLMHALGFWHEHDRPSRDADIEVLWENVQDGLQCFFDKYRNETDFVEQLPYDLASVTHISLNTWAKQRNLETLRPKTASNESDIGFKQTLSELDVQRICSRYNCTMPDTTTTNQPTSAVTHTSSTQQPTTTDPITTQQPTTSQTPATTTTTPPTTANPITTQQPATSHTPATTTTQPTTTRPITTQQPATTTIPPTTANPSTTTSPTTTGEPTNPSPPPTTMPTTFLPPQIVCKGEPNGRMLPYPADCHKFYKCDGGRDYVCCCPLPLVFSEQEATCNHPWKVPCQTPDTPSECPDHSVPDHLQCRYTRHGQLH